MRLITFEGRGIPSNSYMLVSGGDAVMIDCSVPARRVTEELEKSGAVLRYIVLTHGHFDHIGSLDEIKNLTGAKIVVHSADAEMLCDGKKNGYSDFFNGEFSTCPADIEAEDGDLLEAGDIEMKIVHTPGHTKGSICIVCGEYMFTGDTLFAGNVGRSDLYGGNGRKLYESLVRISGMEPSLVIYPGHGGASTLSKEIGSNFYIAEALDILGKAENAGKDDLK